MNPNENHPEAAAIDAVITWVDGSDPAHIAKREAALRRDRSWSLTAIPAGRAATRFADNGELRYCVAGIRKFLPWIRTIHLVTDAQRPAFLDEETCRHLRVNIVDHTEIFRGYEWALPTFNSQTIETMLHRISGLADKFLYFNDDVFVTTPTEPSDFFTPNGVVVRGQWMRLQAFGPFRQAVSGLANHLFERALRRPRPMHILPQMRAAKMAGVRNHFLRNHHVPLAARRSTIVSYFHKHPKHLEQNIQYRFRDMRQFAAIPLAIHLEIASGSYVEAIVDEHLTIGFSVHNRQDTTDKIAGLPKARYNFLCIQSLDHATNAERREVFRHLETTINPLDLFPAVRDNPQRKS